MKFNLILISLCCLVAQSAYGIVVDYDGKSYRMSVDKNKQEVSISEIETDRLDQKTKLQDGDKNYEDEKIQSLELSEKNDVSQSVTASKQTVYQETEFGGSDRNGTRNSNGIVLRDENIKSKRLANFKKQLAGKREKESYRVSFDDTDIAIETFTKRVYSSLKQLRQKTLNNPGNELAAEDAMLAQILGQAIAERTDRIIDKLSEGKRLVRTSEEVTTRYRDLLDLKRVENALDIVDFSEKALQAMGEL